MRFLSRHRQFCSSSSGIHCGRRPWSPRDRHSIFRQSQPCLADDDWPLRSSHRSSSSLTNMSLILMDPRDPSRPPTTCAIYYSVASQGICKLVMQLPAKCLRQRRDTASDSPNGSPCGLRLHTEGLRLHNRNQGLSTALVAAALILRCRVCPSHTATNINHTSLKGPLTLKSVHEARF